MESENKKKSKITNKNYREFIDQGIINTINKEQINKVIYSLEHRHQEQARNLVRTLFYTGARPKEILLLKAKNFSKEGIYIKVLVPGVKRGLTRTIYLDSRDEEISKLYDWTQKHYPDLLLFWAFISSKTRNNIKAKLRNGEYKTYTNEYQDTTNNLRYWFNKWFKILNNESYTPYFLRHNHFSRLAEHGASMEDIMFLKGAKSMESVRPYLHLSSTKAKKLARLKMD